MKKIILVTYGSRGDVQPLLALSVALKEKGHDAQLVAPPEHREWVESFGVPFHPLGSDAKEFVRQTPDPTLKNIKRTIFFLVHQIQRQFEELPKLLEGADLVIRSGLTLAAHTVCEAIKVPDIAVALAPQIYPSASHPSPWLRRQSLPGFINRLGWRTTNSFNNFVFRDIVNHYRKIWGLPPIADFWAHYIDGEMIIATDKLLGEVPTDANSGVFQPGYLHLDQKEELAGDLLEFIEAGDPPLFAGFGSMANDDPEAMFRIIVDAARENGQRVIISKGWQELKGSVTGDDVFVADEAPHALLYPKVRAVIHHGGAGTTATAARAGVPQILIPHMTDQFYWANRVYITENGPKPIWRSRLTTRRLTKAIGEATTNGHIIRRARTLGMVLRESDAIVDTVEYIEKYLQKNNQ